MWIFILFYASQWKCTNEDGVMDKGQGSQMESPSRSFKFRNVITIFQVQLSVFIAAVFHAIVRVSFGNSSVLVACILW